MDDLDYGFLNLDVLCFLRLELFIIFAKSKTENYKSFLIICFSVRKLFSNLIIFIRIIKTN